MTAGNDVLFPGGHQVLSLDEDMAQRVLKEVAEREPPEFAYITLSAWGDPGTVGTIAVVDDFQYSPLNQSTLVCSGIVRFRVLQLNESLTQAQIQIFHDDAPSEEQLDKVVELEKQLVATVKEIVTLSIKLRDDAEGTDQRALEEKLKRVEAFCNGSDDGTAVDHWILELSPEIRRELLSFIVLDMLSVSFMDRRDILQSTDTSERIDAGLRGLEPHVRELAAKGAIVGALGRDDADDTTSSPN